MPRNSADLHADPERRALADQNMKMKKKYNNLQKIKIRVKIRVVDPREDPRQLSSGQLMIESMIAMSILVVAIFSIFAFISRSISLNRVVSDQYVASYLAAEGIEIVRNIIDTNLMPPHCRAWNSGLALFEAEAEYDSPALLPVSGEPLKFDDASGLYGYGSGEKTRFYRTLELENIGNPISELRVNSLVKWTGRGNSKNQVNIEDHFYNWRSAASGCNS